MCRVGETTTLKQNGNHSTENTSATSSDLVQVPASSRTSAGTSHRRVHTATFPAESWWAAQRPGVCGLRIADCRSAAVWSIAVCLQIAVFTMRLVSTAFAPHSRNWPKCGSCRCSSWISTKGQEGQGGTNVQTGNVPQHSEVAPKWGWVLSLLGCRSLNVESCGTSRHFWNPRVSSGHLFLSSVNDKRLRLLL